MEKNNKTKKKIYDRKWRAINPEKVRRSSSLWRSRNKDYPKKYYAKNRKKLCEYNKKYIKIYLEKYPEKKIEKSFISKKSRLKITISFKDYQKLLEGQNNLCAICKNNEISVARSGVVKTLAIDHCHKTKKVRGLLCSKCNVGLGNFNDDVELLKKAIKYVKKYQ